MKQYDFVVVGAGLFGACFAHKAVEKGKKCLVIEKRPHIGGNIYTKRKNGIDVHEYGAHIFHTNNREIWEFVNRVAEFNNFINAPIANYKGEIYNLPFNMNTFNKMWGVVSPQEAIDEIERQKCAAGIQTPQNLEEQAISLVGTDIYEKLIKHYTEKQWMKPCAQLPAFIIKRLPVRFTYDNNYYNARYQGIPVNGYTAMVEKLLDGCEVRIGTNFFEDREYFENLADKLIFTGTIDSFFDYCFGELEYRSLRFETQELPIDNYQGNAVVNYTDSETPHTRIIEHKHFNFGKQPTTVITKEFSRTCKRGDEPFYPVNDERNRLLFEKYASFAKEKKPNVAFGGRLGEYRYYDMDASIEAAFDLAQQLIGSV